jgi:hypothetical protein
MDNQNSQFDAHKPPSSLKAATLPLAMQLKLQKPAAGCATERVAAVIKAEREHNLISDGQKRLEKMPTSKTVSTNSRAELLNSYKKNNASVPKTISQSTAHIKSSNNQVFSANSSSDIFTTTYMINNKLVGNSRIEAPVCGAGEATHHYPKYDIINGRDRVNPHYLPSDHHRNPANSEPHGEVVLKSASTNSSDGNSSSHVTIYTTSSLRDNINAKRTFMYIDPQANLLRKGIRNRNKYNIITNENTFA